MDESKQSKKTPPAEDPNDDNKAKWIRRNMATVLLISLLLGALGIVYLVNAGAQTSVVAYGFFRQQLDQGNIEAATNQGDRVIGKFVERPLVPFVETNEEENARETHLAQTTEKTEPKRYEKKFAVVLPAIVNTEDLDKLLYEKLGDRYNAQPLPNDTGFLTFMSFSLILFFGVMMWLMYRRSRDQMMGGGGMLSGYMKSPAQRYESSKERTTFKDVAGLEGVKRDLSEIVDFLKDPEKYQRLGGRVPKGVLLMGPPGTGKTLLARAVAGEADVPFFSISGSEFIQMFVGVGAGRVRDLFKKAKEAAPAILFIDEIDAVGRHRGAGLGGGHDEREQTLNQILSEMDGFEQTESVIVLAATNRPDVLDPALLRPGRFDRHVTVERPTLAGRRAIFGVHVRDILLAADVDFDRLAAGSVGLTGADIRNLCNEAALEATRKDKSSVEMEDFEIARDKILMGAKREEVLSDNEKKMTAYHEAGHALLAWILPGLDRLHKVTIIPRGRSLGVTQLVPKEERMNYGERDLKSRLTFMLGGRAAEKLVYDEVSAGAENDLSQATKLARKMVAQWGMSERLGPVAYHMGEDQPFLGKEIHEQRNFSEHTAQVIDEEIARILHEAADQAKSLLAKNRDKLNTMADALVEREILDENEVEALIGPSAHESNGRPLT